MFEVKKAAFPSPEQLQLVIHGARNAYKSWDKSDSAMAWDEVAYKIFYYIGEKDRALLKNLINAQGGEPSHSKFLRQLPVILDINAPEYFWRQLDTYKVGTTANSTSQMHVLLKNKFSTNDFSFENLPEPIAVQLVNTLNELRDVYLNETDPKTKEMIWHQVLELVPQSYNYRRMWSANYQVLRTIVKQRKGHPLKEWATFIEWIRVNVPMAKELIFNEWEEGGQIKSE